MNRISFDQQLFNQVANKPKQKTIAKTHADFAQALKESIQSVNQAQLNSEKVTNQFINGQITDLHHVMIAAEKASVTRTLTIEVRNKVIDAYKEIMRMPI